MVSLRRSPDEDTIIAYPGGPAIARVPDEVRIQFQYLVTRLDLHGGGVPPCLAITSALSGEGVSLAAQSLAAVLCDGIGREVCVVETNWWAEENDEERGPGLGEVIAGRMALDDVVRATNIEGFGILGCGELAADERERAATTEALRTVLLRLRNRFDHVIVDLPAIAVSSTALAFAGLADASLLVTRQRMTQLRQASAAAEDLRHANLLGIVLNDTRVSTPPVVQRWLRGQ